MMLPDLDSLRCFEAAAARLNFREAASVVGLSPPAFSQRIRRLEEQLDTKLFERTTRRVALTTEGRRLRPHARRCVEQAGQCRAIVHAHTHAGESGESGESGEIGEIMVGAGHEYASRWIVPRLGELSGADPTCELNVFFGGDEEIFRHLRRGRVDCVVVRGDAPSTAGSGSFEREILSVAGDAMCWMAAHPRGQEIRRLALRLRLES